MISTVFIHISRIGTHEYQLPLLKQRVVLSFDDFVGASEDRRRQSEAECFWPS